MFDFVEQCIDTPALTLRYHLAPWDRQFFPGNTAAISSIHVQHGKDDAAFEFVSFRAWCADNDVRLVSCRLAQERLVECGFLESLGFRFIELNYRPCRSDLGEFTADPEITVGCATAEDEAELIAIASRIFTTGRLHLDPQIGPEIGDRRYAAWITNAFNNPKQTVLTCRMEARIIGFLVLEKLVPNRRFWSLIGLAPQLVGQGLGRRTWQSLLAFHAIEGVTEVSTSISSHNLAVFNLYVSLGFRFPPPGDHATLVSHRTVGAAARMIRAQFVRYVAIGLGLNAALYLAYLLLSWRIMGSRGAMTVTFSVGVLLSFIANRHLTFRHRGNHLGALLRFIACYAILYTVNFTALWVFAEKMGVAHQIVQGGVILALPLFAFTLQKYWVFSDGARRTTTR